MSDLALTRHVLETQAAQGLTFQTPGHRGGSGAPDTAIDLLGRAVFEADLNARSGFASQHDPESALAGAQARTADLVGAARSRFLVGGVSVANVAAICAAVGDGEKLLVARGSHASVYAGLWASGARPVYLTPVRNVALDGLFGVDPGQVRAALAADPAIRALHVTAPDRYGLTIPLAEIARIAREHDVALIVDESHGSHFAFHPRLPAPALACGADIVVHSPHLALGALTQTALLHHQGDRIAPRRIDRALRMLEPTSPSAPLLISLTAALDEMRRRGMRHWERALALAEVARTAIASVNGLAAYGEELIGTPGIAGLDPAKLVVDTTGLGVTGVAAERWLAERRQVRAEEADLRRLVFGITMADTPHTISHLIGALASLSYAAPETGGRTPAVAAIWPRELPEIALTPRAAVAAPCEPVALRDAVGRVAGELVIAHPPGVPLLVPGEVISTETIATLSELRAAGCRIAGPIDATGDTIGCLATDAAQPAGLAAHCSMRVQSATATSATSHCAGR